MSNHLGISLRVTVRNSPAHMRALRQPQLWLTTVGLFLIERRLINVGRTCLVDFGDQPTKVGRVGGFETP